MFLTEGAFSVVEPIIEKHCPEYGPHSRWGITTIPRDRWNQAVANLQALEDNLSGPNALDTIAGLRFIVPEVREDFYRDPQANRLGVVRMIGELVAWIEGVLIAHDHISILGV